MLIIPKNNIANTSADYVYKCMNLFKTTKIFPKKVRRWMQIRPYGLFIEAYKISFSITIWMLDEEMVMGIIGWKKEL